MLFVHDFPFQLNEEKDIEKFNPFESNDQYFKRLIWKKDPDHKYKLKNGISKCARNIRARRFRAKTKYNKEEILDVAKKLKSIIDVKNFFHFVFKLNIFNRMELLILKTR